jgi:hypothetical protein
MGAGLGLGHRDQGLLDKLVEIPVVLFGPNHA